MDPVGGLSGMPAPADQTSSAKLARSARDFEAMAIGEFLQPMFSTVDDQSDLFGGGEAEGVLKPMLVTEFAKMMEDKGGLGLSTPIEEKMQELQNGRTQRR